MHRCLNWAAPQYLSELIQPLSDIDSCRRLRSASMAEVLVPAMWRSTIGDRALAVAGPSAWNNLPVDLHPDISYFQNTPELTSVQQSFPSVWLYRWLFFVHRALEAACAAYASLNLSLLHYITYWCNIVSGQECDELFWISGLDFYYLFCFLKLKCLHIGV